MRPEKLEFCGVKSYTDKVTIDFSNLLKGGLFGIFGNTGSGKSTILDCIFLSLYGRLPKNTDREDYINTKTSKCFVRFTFSLVINGERKYYEVYREFQTKGDRKNAPQPLARLYEISSGDKLPVEDNTSKVNSKVREIIGLDIDDFEKCIVLPQGQFSAFVSLKRAERLQMMSGLFNLYKYGDRIEDRLKTKLYAFDRDMQYNEGLMASYSDVGETALNELNKETEDTKSLYEAENVNLLKIKDKFNDYKNDYEARNQLENSKKDLERLLDNKADIERYKNVVLKLPICVKYYEALSEAKKIETEKCSLVAKLQGLTDEENAVKKLVEELELKLNGKDDLLKRVQSIDTDLGKLDVLKSDETECALLENDLIALREKYADLSKKYSDTSLLLSEKKARLLEVKNSEKYYDLEGKISREIDSLIQASQNTFINEELDFLKKLNGKLPEIEEVRRRIEYLSGLKSENDSVENAVITLNGLYSLMDEYLKTCESFSADISRLQSSGSDLSAKIANVKNEGETLRSRVDKIKTKIFEVTEGKVLQDKISSLKDEKSNIESFLNDVGQKLLKAKSRQSEILLGITSLTSDVKNAEQTIRSANDKLNAYKSEFDVSDNLEEIYSFKDKSSEITKKIDDFNLRKATLKEKISALEEKLSGKEVSDEVYDNLSREVSICEEKVKNLFIKYNNLLNDGKKLSLNLEKRCKIEDELKKLKKKKGVVSELFDSVKHKRFLEYIAEEYLAEIALDARSVLLELTGGRFGLVYSGDFYIEDYIYSSGVKRRIDSVSGGELFLVSLSLALALSKCIYAKSARPMEFFFLDEGFGSLDKELIDTVVDCLYKLKNSDFSIGIISHVDALKERLPVRINVTGATGDRGSSITITA